MKSYEEVVRNSLALLQAEQQILNSVTQELLSAKPSNDADVFYRIQFSHQQTDDWYAYDGNTYGSLESAQKQFNALKGKKFNYDYRIVRVTVTEEVVEEWHDPYREVGM